MKDTRESAIWKYRPLATKFQWNWYVTMKGSARDPAWLTRDLFNRWISELQAKEGTRNFRWVFVMKSRRMAVNADCRVLIGGLRNRMRYWKSRVSDLGGAATIVRFDPSEDDETLRMLEGLDDMDLISVDSYFPESTPGALADASGEVALMQVRIDKIDEDTSLADLKKLFKDYKISETLIYTNRREIYGLVTLGSEDAEDAIRVLDKRQWRGEEIRVTEAKP